MFGLIAPTVTGEPPAEVSTWPAEKVPVNVGIETFGGEGATVAKIKYVVRCRGSSKRNV